MNIFSSSFKTPQNHAFQWLHDIPLYGYNIIYGWARVTETFFWKIWVTLLCHCSKVSIHRKFNIFGCCLSDRFSCLSLLSSLVFLKCKILFILQLSLGLESYNYAPLFFQSLPLWTRCYLKWGWLTSATKLTAISHILPANYSK